MNREKGNIVLKKDDIEEVEFIFENNESMIIYKNSIKELNLIKNDFKCNILLSPTAIYYNDISKKHKNPFERIQELDDITQINFKTKQGEQVEIGIDWYNEEPDNPYYMPMNNELQTSQLLDWNELELNILNI